ncbi:MAG: hypothetical protein U5N53_30660 [Mycobacterium sp.]|nr:hypothetical protein [Mycobacterium sp.]
MTAGSAGAPADSGLVLAVRAVFARTGDVRSASGTVMAPEPEPADDRADRVVFCSPVLDELESDDVLLLPVLDELEELVELEDEEEDDESPASAKAVGADASATPTPRVTAKAPTRPMCLA